MQNKMVVDWELSLKLAGNRPEIANEMFQLFIETLPKELATIQECYNNNNLPSLLAQVHRLHGASCYCGVPHLKNALASFETALKQNNLVNLSVLMASLIDEANAVLRESKEIVSTLA